MRSLLHSGRLQVLPTSVTAPAAREAAAGPQDGQDSPALLFMPSGHRAAAPTPVIGFAVPPGPQQAQPSSAGVQPSESLGFSFGAGAGTEQAPGSAGAPTPGLTFATAAPAASDAPTPALTFGSVAAAGALAGTVGQRGTTAARPAPLSMSPLAEGTSAVSSPAGSAAVEDAALSPLAAGVAVHSPAASAGGEHSARLASPAASVGAAASAGAAASPAGSQASRRMADHGLSPLATGAAAHSPAGSARSVSSAVAPSPAASARSEASHRSAAAAPGSAAHAAQHALSPTAGASAASASKLASRLPVLPSTFGVLADDAALGGVDWSTQPAEAVVSELAAGLPPPWVPSCQTFCPLVIRLAVC